MRAIGAVALLCLASISAVGRCPAGPAFSNTIISYLGFGSDVASLHCAAVPNCGPPGADAVGINNRENCHAIKTGVNFHF